jgi:hypothetical protein
VAAAPSPPENWVEVEPSGLNVCEAKGFDVFSRLFFVWSFAAVVMPV